MNSYLRLVSLLTIATLVFLFPSTSWAWGPITHIDYASEALRHLSSYGPAVKAVLERCPFDFLYGSLAADITLGKDYVDYVHNCHNWRVGFLILKDAQAQDDAQKAAALGYLSHLSVDIISHNFFVPYKTIRSYSTRTLGHIYWEMRFDAKRPQKAWDLAHEISGMEFPEDDALFEKRVRKTIFSFKTNRKIFRSVLTLHKLKQWRAVMTKVHEISRLKFHDHDIEEYRNLAVQSAVDFLRDPQGAPCLRVDPTGAKKLAYADKTRKQMRELVDRKIIDVEEADDLLKKIKLALKKSIYENHPLPNLAKIYKLDESQS